MPPGSKQRGGECGRRTAQGGAVQQEAELDWHPCLPTACLQHYVILPVLPLKWPKCFTDIRLDPKECLVLQFRSDRITAISYRPNTGSFNPHNNYIKFHISQMGRLINRAKEFIHPRSTARISPSWGLNPCWVYSQCP